MGHVCNTVEGHCILAIIIAHHHANGRFDWLFLSSRASILREKQLLYYLGNTKDLRLSILCLQSSFKLEPDFKDEGLSRFIGDT